MLRSRAHSRTRPKLLIADEPTTALDVTVQAGILRLLDRLRREHGLSVILITHDLGVLSSIADHVSIFYAGRIVESGPTRELLGRSTASVHARPARRAPSSRGRGPGRAPGDPGTPAEPAQPAVGVRLPSPLCLRAAGLRGERAAVRARLVDTAPGVPSAIPSRQRHEPARDSRVGRRLPPPRGGHPRRGEREPLRRPRPDRRPGRRVGVRQVVPRSRRSRPRRPRGRGDRLRRLAARPLRRGGSIEERDPAADGLPEPLLVAEPTPDDRLPGRGRDPAGRGERPPRQAPTGCGVARQGGARRPPPRAGSRISSAAASASASRSPAPSPPTRP